MTSFKQQPTWTKPKQLRYSSKSPISAYQLSWLKTNKTWSLRQSLKQLLLTQRVEAGKKKRILLIEKERQKL